MSGEADDDHELVTRVRAGDYDQFRVLVDRHKDAIVALIYRQVADYGIAEDLAQETFLRAFRSLRSFRADAALRTWLVRIALNLTSSYFASRAYKERSCGLSFDVQRYDQLLAPNDDQVTWEDRQCLRALLAELPPKLRHPVVLVVVEGWRYEDAAALLGVPLGTVSSRVTAALQQLRKRIEGRSV